MGFWAPPDKLNYIPAESVALLHEILKNVDCPKKYYKKLLRLVVWWLLTPKHFRKNGMAEPYKTPPATQEYKDAFLKRWIHSSAPEGYWMVGYLASHLLTEKFKKTGEVEEYLRYLDMSFTGPTDPRRDDDYFKVLDWLYTPPGCKSYMQCIDELEI